LIHSAIFLVPLIASGLRGIFRVAAAAAKGGFAFCFFSVAPAVFCFCSLTTPIVDVRKSTAQAVALTATFHGVEMGLADAAAMGQKQKTAAGTKTEAEVTDTLHT
jgi:hypothetical protein